MNNTSYSFDFSPEYVIFDLCAAEVKNGCSTPNQKGEVLIKCPITEKFFEVNLKKGGTWCCFKGCSNCPGGNSGGILNLYRLFFNRDSNKDALNAINDKINQKPGFKEELRRKSEKIIPQLQLTPVASAADLDKTYNCLLNNLSLSKKHRADLISRGLTSEDIETMRFKSIPQSGIRGLVNTLINNDCVLDGVPGFYKTEKGYYRLNLRGSGIIIPYRDQYDQIVGLQIRRDVEITPDMSEEEEKEAKSKRYRWVTSSSYEGGTACKNHPFYGIPGKPKGKIVYATEGGLKASVARSLSGGCFVAIPGITCYTAWEELLSYLRKEGVTTLVDAFDSDRATKQNVNDAIKKLYSIASEYGFEMKPWNWGTEHKGVDDFLLFRKQTKVLRR